jgi:hypothetical protein
VNGCQIDCCDCYSVHLNLKAVVGVGVVTAATEAAEETVRTGEDYLVVHSKLH